VPADVKIARLMGLAAIKDFETNIEKCVFLRSAGFTNAEIADMLVMSNNQVAVAFVQSRKKKKKRRKSS
jgi:orotate phosphoribosyltransferase-like protein